MNYDHHRTRIDLIFWEKNCYRVVQMGQCTNLVYLSSVVLAAGYLTSMARSSLKAGSQGQLEFVDRLLFCDSIQCKGLYFSSAY